MNYIISSIILLAVILIIIYILSIDNNIEKFSNKIKDIFNTVKSNKLNFLSEKDNINLLNFIKISFKNEDNVTIPKKNFYNKTDLGYEIDNLDIICYKYNENTFQEKSYKVNVLFVPFEKEHYISNQSLLGMHGNYKIQIVPCDHMSGEKFGEQSGEKSGEQCAKKISKKPSKKVTIENTDIYNYTHNMTDVLDMIPDIIHLTSEDDTTDTIALISHNLK